jgi:hypothetical protein
LLGGCNPEAIAEWKRARVFFYGNVLAIYDAADDLAGSCQEMFSLSAGKGLARHDEVVLNVGIGHGILYKPLDEWLIPTIEWARGEGQP